MSSCLRAVRDAVFGWAEAAGETARAGDPVATTAAAVNAMRLVSTNTCTAIVPHASMEGRAAYIPKTIQNEESKGGGISPSSSVIFVTSVVKILFF